LKEEKKIGEKNFSYFPSFFVDLNGKILMGIAHGGCKCAIIYVVDIYGTYHYFAINADFLRFMDILCGLCFGNETRYLSYYGFYRRGTLPKFRTAAYAGYINICIYDNIFSRGTLIICTKNTNIYQDRRTEMALSYFGKILLAMRLEPLYTRTIIESALMQIERENTPVVYDRPKRVVHMKCPGEKQ
jgi:hypothetical protein